MNNESEMVIVQATGFSPWRLARPVLLFSVVILCFLLVLSHVLSPISQAQLRERQSEISSDISARLLREGVFVQATRGVTFFIEDISPNGALSQIMVSDTRSGTATTTYTASRATLLRQEEGTMLVLLDGLIQHHDTTTGRLSTTSFDRFVFDVSDMAGSVGSNADNPALKTSRWLSEAAKTDADNAAEFRAEIHQRNGEALFATAAVLLAFAVMTAGHFSRSGMWTQIGWAIVLVVIGKALDNQMIAEVTRNAQRSGLYYVAPVIVAIVSLVLLGVASRPAGAPWKKRRSAT